MTSHTAPRPWADAAPGPLRRARLVPVAVERSSPTRSSEPTTSTTSDDVLDALVQQDIQDVKRGTHERGEVEDIFERLILGRAYERAAAKRYDDARADFDAVAEQTGSYEADRGGRSTCA